MVLVSIGDLIAGLDRVQAQFGRHRPILAVPFFRGRPIRRRRQIDV